MTGDMTTRILEGQANRRAETFSLKRGWVASRTWWYKMLVFPAIDLRQGRCVRLRQGDPTAETVYGEDPAAMARHWVDQGAQWLHVVNLDGALGDQDAVNLRRLDEIRQVTAVPIQFGGGLRTMDDVQRALQLGASRVVLGTAAVRWPDRVVEAIGRFGAERILVGIDARNGRVATHGWRRDSGQVVTELAIRMRALGLLRAVYTDIARDGMLSGVGAAATAQLARASGLALIASGGVRDIEDIRQLKSLESAGIEGVIVGQALYTGTLDLRAAMAIASA